MLNMNKSEEIIEKIVKAMNYRLCPRKGCLNETKYSEMCTDCIRIWNHACFTHRDELGNYTCDHDLFLQGVDFEDPNNRLSRQIGS